MSGKRTLIAWHSPPKAHGGATVLPMRGLCPLEKKLTAYDKRNMSLYTFLLVADEDGATVEELAEEVFKFDLSTNRAWAIRATLSHLQRARWVYDQCFPTLE